MREPVRLVFLGCGFITGVHSVQLEALGGQVVAGYASRDHAKAESYCRRYRGFGAYPDYVSALRDPTVEAVVVAVPPKFHLGLTLEALRAGKHVLVEKPAFLTQEEYETVRAARDASGKVVLVGENDHYKPLAVCLRQLLADEVIGELVFAHFTTIVRRLKSSGDWRNDASMAGGDAFFEEGIHWLHFAGSLGPSITAIHGYQPSLSREHDDRDDTRAKSMLVAFSYDSGAVGALYYSREVPSMLRGLRLSTLFGRKGVITFESNGAAVLVRTRGAPRVIFPGLRDIRGYRAMYRDFAAAIRGGPPAAMTLERAVNDHVLMDQVYGATGHNFH